MKAKIQKLISLAEIAYQLDTHNLSTARLSLADAIGASLRITGEIVKVARRDDLLRLVVSTNTNNRKILIFANFDDETEKAKVKEMKIRKNSSVSITGIFSSFGSDAVCLSGCKLNRNKEV